MKGMMKTNLVKLGAAVSVLVLSLTFAFAQTTAPAGQQKPAAQPATQSQPCPENAPTS